MVKYIAYRIPEWILSFQNIATCSLHLCSGCFLSQNRSEQKFKQNQIIGEFQGETCPIWSIHVFMSTRVIFFILGGIGENEVLFSSSAGLPDSCYLFTPVNILVARSTQKSKKHHVQLRLGPCFTTQRRQL